MAEALTIPGKLQTVLGENRNIPDMSRKYQRVDDFFFAGRGIHYPIALDGP